MPSFDRVLSDAIDGLLGERVSAELRARAAQMTGEALGISEDDFATEYRDDPKVRGWYRDCRARLIALELDGWLSRGSRAIHAMEELRAICRQWLGKTGEPFFLESGPAMSAVAEIVARHDAKPDATPITRRAEAPEHGPDAA